jgi:membrane-associated phospholipid phosphatase
VLIPPTRTRRRWVAIATGFVVLVALSRVYLRAHWLSDATAGGLLGAGLAVLWPALLQPMVEQRTRERPESPVPAAR